MATAAWSASRDNTVIDMLGTGVTLTIYSMSITSSDRGARGKLIFYTTKAIKYSEHYLALIKYDQNLDLNRSGVNKRWPRIRNMNERMRILTMKVTKGLGDVGLDNITNLIANLCHHSLKRGCAILGCAHTNTN